MQISSAITIYALLLLAAPAHAGNVSGVVTAVDARVDNSCRYVTIKKSDGTSVSFRIAAGAGSEGVFAAAVTARLSVDVQHSSNSGCGGDQAIDIIRIAAQ